MAIHDYACTSCDWTEFDSKESWSTCPRCDSKVTITYQHWNTIMTGRDNNCLFNTDGSRNRYGVLDDPLCLLKLGLKKDNHSGFNSMVPNIQKAELLNKLQTDGDSPKLREQVLQAGK